jgi:hypothetical protein
VLKKSARVEWEVQVVAHPEKYGALAQLGHSEGRRRDSAPSGRKRPKCGQRAAPTACRGRWACPRPFSGPGFE